MIHEGGAGRGRGRVGEVVGWGGETFPPTMHLLYFRTCSWLLSRDVLHVHIIEAYCVLAYI